MVPARLPAQHLTRFGSYVAPGFLDEGLCARARADAGAALKAPLGVLWKEDVQIDETLRRTHVARVSASTEALVVARLEALTPTLARHFDLTGPVRWQPLQFLVYDVGDFFVPHVDRPVGGVGEDAVSRRLVSVVVFLAGSSTESPDDAYEGGDLIFYGLLGDPRAREYGLAIRPETGLLIAFRPEVVHEVTPVTSGRRFTLVTWVAAASDPD